MAPDRRAIHPDSIATFRLLITYPATFFRDVRGRTVAHTAAERGSVLATEAILAIRPEAVDDLDKTHRTPLFWAAACGQCLPPGRCVCVSFGVDVKGDSAGCFSCHNTGIGRPRGVGGVKQTLTLPPN